MITLSKTRQTRTDSLAEVLNGTSAQSWFGSSVIVHTFYVWTLESGEFFIVFGAETDCIVHKPSKAAALSI